jgi:hypothetical protein
MLEISESQDTVVSVSPVALTPENRAFLDNLHALPVWRQWLERQLVRLYYWRSKFYVLLSGLVVLVVAGVMREPH